LRLDPRFRELADAELSVIPGASHGLLVEKPTLCNAMIVDFLTNDPEMRSLATQYGFRTTDVAAFTKFVSDHKLPVPPSLINVIDPPTYETLEAMITRLEAAYAGQGLPTAVPDQSVAPRASALPGFSIEAQPSSAGQPSPHPS